MSVDRDLRPNSDHEWRLWSAGEAEVAGLDEVGRGPLAGPVVAAAVVFPICFEADWLDELRDSKVISHRKREYLARLIAENAEIGIGSVPSMLVDRIGIARAARHAMVQATSRLSCAPSHLLIDAFYIPELDLPQTAIIHGDALVTSIAAASIVAKVERDRLMVEYDGMYPGYELSRNKGYGTRSHIEGLRRLGASPIHRRTFSPVRTMATLQRVSTL